MSKAKDAIARARRTATEAKNDAAEFGSGIVTSYLIGSLEASGNMTSIPQFMGLPRTLTLALAAKLVEYNASGIAKQVAAGVGNASAHIAIHEFARGQTVSGASGMPGIATHDRGRRLQAAAERQLTDTDRELDEIEGVRPRRTKTHAAA